jgi:hypothetical protein
LLVELVEAPFLIPKRRRLGRETQPQREDPLIRLLRSQAVIQRAQDGILPVASTKMQFLAGFQVVQAQHAQPLVPQIKLA